MHRHPCVVYCILGLVTTSVGADGPADTISTAVRRIPKLGIDLAPETRTELVAGLDELRAAIDRVARLNDERTMDLLTDVEICFKAVHDAVAYQEFFTEAEVAKARDLVVLGKRRSAEIVTGNARWPSQSGLIVRGYKSMIDGSVQPYGLVVPEAPMPPHGYRLDVWFHGRGETLSEVNFLDERRKRPGEFTPPGTIVLHPYGRYCNANKFAGEVDVLEAIESVQARYRIDPDRIAVRGFSMGGAACWQFAVHYSDRWFAANPGAGFAETPRFLNVFQKETVQPTWYEQKLWHLYDCTDYAGNLFQCPTVAYSGELDAQKQAADVMAEALKKTGIDLLHVIGPRTKHAYHPQAKREVEERLASLAESGRTRIPSDVRFTTYSLKYNRMNWVTIDALGEHWEEAVVDATLGPSTIGGGSIDVGTRNVKALTLSFPSGSAPFPINRSVRVDIDGTTIDVSPKSDRSWSVSLERTAGEWKLARPRPPGDGLRKRHDLQGPIDDAFMSSFVFVRPTAKSARARFQSWIESEMNRAIEHWRRQFRGEARVKDDVKIDETDIATCNLVLWGDPESNAILKNIAGRLPIVWDERTIKVGERAFDADNHALIMIHPNPLNPNRYVVLNSGFTFRDYDYLNNARQVPKLPDWAVVDVRTPPDARYPGKIVAADFFGER
jgi:dienelactone hydrolase